MSSRLQIVLRRSHLINAQFHHPPSSRHPAHGKETRKPIRLACCGTSLPCVMVALLHCLRGRESLTLLVSSPYVFLNSPPGEGAVPG